MWRRGCAAVKSASRTTATPAQARQGLTHRGGSSDTVLFLLTGDGRGVLTLLSDRAYLRTGARGNESDPDIIDG